MPQIDCDTVGILANSKGNTVSVNPPSNLAPSNLGSPLPEKSSVEGMQFWLMTNDVCCSVFILHDLFLLLFILQRFSSYRGQEPYVKVFVWDGSSFFGFHYHITILPMTPYCLTKSNVRTPLFPRPDSFQSSWPEWSTPRLDDGHKQSGSIETRNIDSAK